MRTVDGVLYSDVIGYSDVIWGRKLALIARRPKRGRAGSDKYGQLPATSVSRQLVDGPVGHGLGSSHVWLLVCFLELKVIELTEYDY